MQMCHCMKNGWGRSKRTWMKTIRKDKENLELSNDMVYDKIKWKEKIYNPVFNLLGIGG